jgi:hypothetical protein
VAGTLGKPKSPEEDTVARKASLKRCASSCPRFPSALLSLIQIVACKNAGIAHFLRKLAAEYEGKEWMKNANALKGAFLLSRKIHSSLLEYTEP